MADTPKTYDITADVQKLAEMMQRRDAQQFGATVDGKLVPSWDDTGDEGQKEYRRDAAWTISMLIGILGYETPRR